MILNRRLSNCGRIKRSFRHTGGIRMKLKRSIAIAAGTDFSKYVSPPIKKNTPHIQSKRFREDFAGFFKLFFI